MQKTSIESAVKLTAQLYECRDTARRLYGDGYQAKIEPYKGFIVAVMAKKSITCHVRAAMALIEDFKEMEGASMATMLILAACVEMVEPKPATNISTLSLAERMELIRGKKW